MTDESETVESEQPFNSISLWDEESRHRVGFRGLPQLVGRAVKIVYRSAPSALVLTVVLSIVVALLSVGQVGLADLALRALLKAAGPGGTLTSALLPMAGLAVLGGLTAVAGVVLSQQQRLMSELVQRQTLADLFDVTTRVPLEMYEYPRFFDQLQRIQTNALQRPTAVAQGLSNVVGGFLGTVAIALALLKIAPVLVPVLLVAGIPALLIGRRASKSEFTFVVSQSTGYRRRYYLQDVLTGRPAAKEVRAFGAEVALRDRWNSAYDDYIGDLRHQVRLRTLLGIASGLATAILGGAALLLIVDLVVKNNLSLAAAGAAVIAVRLLNGRVDSLAAGVTGLYQSALFLLDYESFMGLHLEQDEPEVPRDEQFVGRFADGFQTLATRGLNFRYPAGSTDAIHDVDLEIKAGEVIALVGENGSGKTTLAKLLAGLYTPTGGTIYWDAADISGVPHAELREAIAVIFQDFLMYALPATDNIGLGRPERLGDREGIVAAAVRSGADPFIQRLSAGYDTYLSSTFPGGRDLSVGQWQRVAIARASFRSAPFIILDEPSSALDPRAEQDLFARIRTLLGGKTVLFVSHRFSTVRSADRILVMSEGRIVEQGSHEELMERDGLYAELFTLQARGYTSHVDSTGVE